MYPDGSGRIHTSIAPLSDDKRLLAQQLELLQKFVIWKKSPVGLESDVTYQQYVDILDNEVPQVFMGWYGLACSAMETIDEICGVMGLLF